MTASALQTELPDAQSLRPNVLSPVTSLRRQKKSGQKKEEEEGQTDRIRRLYKCGQMSHLRIQASKSKKDAHESRRGGKSRVIAEKNRGVCVIRPALSPLSSSRRRRTAPRTLIVFEAWLLPANPNILRTVSSSAGAAAVYQGFRSFVSRCGRECCRG